MDQLYHYTELQSTAANHTLTAQSASRIVYTTVNCVRFQMNQFVAVYTGMTVTHQFHLITVCQIDVEMIII